jgi:prepilin-type N-terminal cleavage/methylation domain-containing protein
MTRVGRRQPQAGFTLFEVMLTMAVLLVAMAIVVPSVSTRLHDAQIDVAKREVYERLAQTRMRAMDQGRSWTFVVAVGERRYRAFPTGRTQETIEWRLADSVRFYQATPAPIYFFSDGTSSESMIVLRGASGSEAAIRVSRLTGVAFE